MVDVVSLGGEHAFNNLAKSVLHDSIIKTPM